MPTRTPLWSDASSRALLVKRCVLLLALSFLLVACGRASDSSPGTDGSSDATNGAGESDSSNGPVVVDGTLQPLADGFPEAPITLWNVFEPGHTDDLFNITVAEIASKYSPVRLATQTNQMGPRSQYAMVEFLDGQERSDEGYHTFAISWFGPTTGLYTQEDLAENEIEDIAPINVMVAAPFIFAVHPNSEFDSLADIAEYARANPGELKTVGSDTGSGLHSSLLIWQNHEEIETTFIPTDGSGHSRQVLLGEGADLGVLTYQPGIEDELKILAVTGAERTSTLPDVPTTEELGVVIPAGSYRGYGLPTNVPAEHVAWLSKLFQLIADDPDFAAAQPGFDVTLRDAAEVRALQQEIVDVFVPVLDEIGLVVRDSE